MKRARTNPADCYRLADALAGHPGVYELRIGQMLLNAMTEARLYNIENEELIEVMKEAAAHG